MKEISENNAIDIWIKKASGSENTERIYRRYISEFFEYAHIAPDELISQWKDAKYDFRAREKFVDEWTEKIESFIYCGFEHFAPNSRMQVLTAIASFFKHHRIEVCPEREKHIFVKHHNRDLKREEIKRILQHANIRDRTFFLMMLESGLRPNTLVQLRWKHIKEDFSANRVPMKIDLPSELLKDRVEPRWTFIGTDAFRSLKEYLKPRMPLHNEDSIFLAERKDSRVPHVSPEAFSQKFSKIALKLRIAEREERSKPKKIRLYCLRKYFMNNIRCDTAYREWWMGHRTTQTHYVSRDVERHREEYTRAYENLRIYKTETPQRITDLTKQIEALQHENRELKNSMQKIQPLIAFINSFGSMEEATRALGQVGKIAKALEEIQEKVKTEGAEAVLKEIEELKAKEKKKSMMKTRGNAT